MDSSGTRIISGAALPATLVGVGATAVSAVLAGTKGALGAVFATVVVVAFFTATAYVMTWASKISPQTMMLAGITSYIVKIVALMVIISVAKNVTIWNQIAFGWTVVALALTWIFAEFRIGMQVRKPYIDEPAAPPAQTGPSRYDRQ
ncbi:hypothetical protein GCM10027589_01610 [Actinocorallia lasiicapitis]